MELQEYVIDPEAKSGQLTFIDPKARRLHARLMDMVKDLAVEVAAAIRQEKSPDEIRALIHGRKAAMEPVFNAVQAAWQFENTHPSEKEIH